MPSSHGAQILSAKHGLVTQEINRRLQSVRTPFFQSVCLPRCHDRVFPRFTLGYELCSPETSSLPPFVRSSTQPWRSSTRRGEAMRGSPRQPCAVKCRCTGSGSRTPGAGSQAQPEAETVRTHCTPSLSKSQGYKLRRPPEKSEKTRVDLAKRGSYVVDVSSNSSDNQIYSYIRIHIHQLMDETY